MLSRGIPVCFLLLFASAVVHGTEFQVNTYTDDAQLWPDVAMADDGNFVVVWDSKGQDGSYSGIYTRRFAPNGQPLGDEFQVNTTTSRSQKTPGVAMDSAGNFVVTWASSDGSNEGVWGRRYNSSGTAITGEFQVNTYTDRRQFYPAVGMNDGGAFAIAWRRWNHPTQEWLVCGQAYSAAGARSGSEFVVTQLAHGYSPEVAMTASGDFTVATSRVGDSLNPPLGSYVRMRPYYANGIPKGSETQLSGGEAGFGGFACDEAGNGVLSYGRADDTYAHRYGPYGNTVGPAFRVNTHTDGVQGGGAVAVNDVGECLIVWSSEHEGTGLDLFAQAYASDGARLGDEFRVNSFTEGDQKFVELALNDDGRYAVVWAGDDVDSYGVFGAVGYIPEPGTLSLLALGACAALRLSRRR